MGRAIFSIFILTTALAGCDRPVNPAPAASVTPAATAPTATASAAPAPSASASSAPAQAIAPGARVVTFDDDPVGGPAAAFEAVVGDFYVAEREGAHGYLVDGSKWRNGTPSASLADQARRLYGERYAEFLDGVKAFAFFPLAVWKEEPPAGPLRISVRFHPIAGKIDQAAGIAFGIAPDGRYLGVRANALEDNLLFFEVTRGKRNVLETVRDVPTPTHTWHTLVVEIRDKALRVELDGKERLKRTLSAAPAGRLGLWSKADSQVLMDDFKVERLP
jgi:hypothetical protein